VKLALDKLLDSSLDRELIGAAIGARSGLMASNRWIIRPQAENFFILDNSDIETAIVPPGSLSSQIQRALSAGVR
jgi:hypothetical protein